MEKRPIGGTSAIEYPPRSYEDQWRAELIAGLSAINATIPTKFLYSPIGDVLYERCLEGGTYWPDEAEIAGFQHVIAKSYPCSQALIFGAGAPAREAQIIEQLINHGTSNFTFVDVSARLLETSTAAAHNAFPSAQIDSRVQDWSYYRALQPPSESVAVVVPGGSLMNLTDVELIRTLQTLRSQHAKGNLFFSSNASLAQIGLPIRFRAETAFTEFRNSIRETLATFWSVFLDGEDLSFSTVTDTDHEQIVSFVSSPRGMKALSRRDAFVRDFSPDERLIFGMTRLNPSNSTTKLLSSCGLTLQDQLAAGSDFYTSRFAW